MEDLCSTENVNCNLLTFQHCPFFFFLFKRKHKNEKKRRKGLGGGENPKQGVRVDCSKGIQAYGVRIHAHTHVRLKRGWKNVLIIDSLHKALIFYCIKNL